jgi:3-deoxy-7-phosphoheptulonate synthase
MIEVHSDPELALSDGPQSLKPEKYRALVRKLDRLATFMEEELK